MSTPTLHGRVAVVVGGTSGIGLALAQGLAEAGADGVPVSRPRRHARARRRHRPCIVDVARYVAPSRPGFSIAIKRDSIADYEYPDGAEWARYGD